MRSSSIVAAGAKIKMRKRRKKKDCGVGGGGGRSWWCGIPFFVGQVGCLSR